jgi:hypothetical protein
MNSVAFFPWLRLRDALIVDEVHLVPYRRTAQPYEGTEVQSRLDELLASHVVHPDSPITEATVIETERGNPFRPLDEEAVSSLYELRELLATAALSQRGYFENGGLSYCNSHLFQLVVQRIQGDGTAVSITSRRREGTFNTVWSSGLHKVRMPDHVHPPIRLDFDIPLLGALIKARRSPRFDSISEAILGYNLANTDSPETTERVESVLLCGAFERLYECGHGRADDLARAFVDTVVPQRPVDPRAVGRTAVHAAALKRPQSMREIWIRDFYLSRNAFAHGRAKATHRSLWNLSEHLLLAAYVFPLALKCVLAGLSVYPLSDDDQTQIGVFEKLASVELFKPDGHPAAPASWPWNTVMEKAREEMFERALKELWRSRPSE